MRTSFSVNARLRSLFIALGLCLGLAGFAVAAPQGDKPVLVIFHGAGETRDDMRNLAEASGRTKMFARVVVIGYDWSESDVPTAAARIFNSLSEVFPDASFVLMGNREGGVLAEWIATRVKASEGKVVRVITLNSPMSGEGGGGSGAATRAVGSLSPGSETIRLLQGSPVVDVSSVEFIRLWEKDDKWVSRESALSEPAGGAAEAGKVIVRTREYDPREALPELTAQAKKYFAERQYEQAAESGKAVLAVEPGDPNTNLLVGLSYYMMGLNSAGSEQAAGLYRSSFGHLSKALDAGLAVTIPVYHHHAELLDQSLCRGYITVTKSSFSYRSVDSGGHEFSVPSSKIYELGLVPDNAGQLHTRVGLQQGKGEHRHNYNFFSAEVKVQREWVYLTPTAPFQTNKIYCTAACVPSMQVVYELVRRSVEHPGSLAERYFQAASDYAQKGQWPEAEGQGRLAVEKEPDNAQYQSLLGDTLAAQGKWETAEGAYRKALALDSDNAQLRGVLARTLYLQKKFEESESEYREALRSDPDNALLLNNFGYELIERDKDLNEALQMIGRAASREPQNASYVDSLGWAYFKLGRLEEAEKTLSEAARLSKRSATILEHLGDVRMRLGKTKEAQTAWKEAAKLLEDESGQKARIMSKINGASNN